MGMKQNIEIEYKSLLSPFDFNRLKASFFKDAVLFVQENRYYDTLNKDLYDRRISLRIRRVNNKSLFTLKQIDAHNQVVEHEVEDDNLDVDDPRIVKLLADLHLPTQLICISSSLTHRLLISDKFGEWCLDRNEFKNHVDFELEYEITEVTNTRIDRFLAFLETNSITYHKASPKYIRSLE